MLLHGIRTRCCTSISLILVAALRLARTDDVELYFGAGCFWHVQHEFIKAEEKILKRSGSTLTSISGYAGHTKSGKLPGYSGTGLAIPCYKDGKVTSEVVGMKIPKQYVSQFATVYWDLMKAMERSHTGDRGPEYRSAIGVPGGIKSPLLAEINGSQANAVWSKSGAYAGRRFELREGVGDDADTYGTQAIWVYDTAKFPFYQAEIYHQFHDDYLPGGNYPASYNNLQVTLTCSGALKQTGCVKAKCDCECLRLNAKMPSPTKTSSGGSGGSGAMSGGGTKKVPTTQTSTGSNSSFGFPLSIGFASLLISAFIHRM